MPSFFVSLDSIDIAGKTPFLMKLIYKDKVCAYFRLKYSIIINEEQNHNE